MATPAVREELQRQGVDMFTTTPEQFAALMKADKTKFDSIIKTANIKFDR